ncbi:hypothetical protein GHT06_022614 [Daphnia sinensis]|uniref:Uncharacterized protein n=1 Tax=Daphnia sinensis TaxID=1820382 RepID=A0AAD5KH94_9CRUS|nr:hypothetical protein GHT06_022614 [Daphnia sinensis]
MGDIELLVFKDLVYYLKIALCGLIDAFSFHLVEMVVPNGWNEVSEVPTNDNIHGSSALVPSSTSTGINWGMGEDADFRRDA